MAFRKFRVFALLWWDDEQMIIRYQKIRCVNFLYKTFRSRSTKRSARDLLSSSNGSYIMFRANDGTKWAPSNESRILEASRYEIGLFPLRRSLDRNPSRRIFLGFGWCDRLFFGFPPNDIYLQILVNNLLLSYAITSVSPSDVNISRFRWMFNWRNCS